MERKTFLKNSLGFLGMALFVPDILRSGSNGSGNGSCSVTNSETAGPFPTITPANLVQTNIVGDRTGVPFTINITVKNVNTNCAALSGATVDIWHCDKDGYYSEYGGTGMQSVDYTAKHFLRGRQVTDANGLVSFVSIFPGWYQSRATHIHVHIYDAGGNSLLVTQIAFPEGTGSAVELVNSSTANGYTKGMTGYTYNASDNVFSDGTGNELGNVTGSIAAGYVLTHDIYVSGPSSVATGIESNKASSSFSVGQNYPNPCVDETTLPLSLSQASDVTIEIYSLQGQKVLEVPEALLDAGNHNLLIRTGTLSKGTYLLGVEVCNPGGTFKQTKMLIKN